MTKKTVMVSGGFDPIHPGHIDMIVSASRYGDVIVVANSDAWLERKKGYKFMSFVARKAILEQIKGVLYVTHVDDSDGTVCEAIRRIKPTFFANGGDRGKSNTPEQDVCDELGVQMLWGVGGTNKIYSSSSLTFRVMQYNPLIGDAE